MILKPLSHWHHTVVNSATLALAELGSDPYTSAMKYQAVVERITGKNEPTVLEVRLHSLGDGRDIVVQLAETEADHLAQDIQFELESE